MHRTVPHAPPLALPALALLVVAACTSSSDGQGDAAPPTGTLPSRFSVLTVSDAQSGQTSVRVLDHDTGQLRTLVGGSAPLLQSSVELSPDGAHLAVVDSVAAGTRVRIVETATGTARTIDLDNGAPLPPPGGRGGDGSSARGGGTAGLVRFSPDGQRLLYLKRDAQLGGFRLELMEANGTGARTLPEPVRGEAFWLPDSARIAAVRHDTAIDAQVAAVYDFETLDRLVSAPALGDFAIVDALRVAADGSSIAYLGEVDVGTEGDWRVGVLNLDTGADAVFDPDVDELEDDRYFELSDDGRRVAFVGYTDDSSEIARVYVGHHGTGALVEASPGAAQARVHFLQWEPGGDRLAFASDHRQVDVEEIFVGDGLGPCDPIWTAVPDDGDVEQVEWSPAGGLIAIAREGAVTDDALFLFDADGVDEPVRVSFGGLAVETEDFVWARDGTRVFARDESGTERRFISVAASDASDAVDLGPAWRGSSFAASSVGDDAPVQTARRPDGSLELVWSAEDATGADVLLTGRIDDPAATATLYDAGPPATGDRIEGFALR